MFHRSRIRVSCFALSSSQRPSLDIKGLEKLQMEGGGGGGCRCGGCGYRGGTREDEELVVIMDVVMVDAMVVDVDTEVEDVRRRMWWWMPWMWMLLWWMWIRKWKM
ncbi:hypothetical protein IGI04_007625 [Brassica rapa subsp. trilocularis]|uniref:Transmembrane protein n=1 Tax=Brassica rapa subsp. trilocularis TaxID=1813537 RepID=A0ABQ7NMA8_BRACM|nr:hypothetical protein IGI04_007625 [Brassica rapa subsp. trilocularis]